MTTPSPTTAPSTTSSHDPDGWREIIVHGLLLRWRASRLQNDSRFWTPSAPDADAAFPDLPRVLISPTAAPPPRGWPSLDTPREASEGVVIAACPSGEGRYLLSYPDMPYPGGPVFQVEADRVLIHGGDDTAPAELSWFLVGPVLSFLLAVRGAAVFHASAVRFGDVDPGGAGAAAAFIGPSGAGKSSLAAALAGRGRAGVTDDLLVLEDDPPATGRRGPARVLPGAPRRLLWPDAARHLASAPPAGQPYRWDKHALAARAWVPREPVALGRLFYLRPAPAAAEPALRPMPARQATAALLGNLRLAWLAGRRRRRDLETVARLVDHRGVDELVVPRDFARLPAVLDLVEESLADSRGEASRAESGRTESGVTEPAPASGPPPVAR